MDYNSTLCRSGTEMVDTDVLFRVPESHFSELPGDVPIVAML